MNNLMNNTSGNDEIILETITTRTMDPSEGMGFDPASDEVPASTSETLEAEFQAEQVGWDDDEVADMDDWDLDEYPEGYTADGCRLNSLGLEIGLDGCALSDEEKEIFCR